MYIVHLSDIHYNPKYQKDYFELFEALNNDLAKLRKDGVKTIIIITGDLIDADVKESKEVLLSESYNLIEQNVLESGIDNHSIFITPGNHDIDYKVYYPNDFNKLGEDKRFSERIIPNFLIDDVSFDNYFKNLETYYSCLKKICEKNNTNKLYSPLLSSYELLHEGKKISINSLNNTWRYREYKETESSYGDMFFSLPQLRKAKEFTKNSKINIAFCHYPLEFIHEGEKREVERDIIKTYDIFLSGHAHSSNNLRLSGPGDQFNGGCIFNYGGNLNIANYKEENKNYEMSYDLIEINEDNVKILHRKYHISDREFVINTTFNNGESTYQLGQYNENFLMLRDILHDQKNSFDRELITNNLGKTKAPKLIHELFISPTLKPYKVDKDLENLTKETLISNGKNAIILAKKECGKSTLLYGVFNDFYRKSLRNGEYPLYVDMNLSYRGNTIKDAIYQNYPVFKKDDIFSELDKLKIRLLIDNIDLQNTEFMDSLQVFESESNCSQIICTALTTSSGRLPIGYTKGNYNYLEPYEIQPLTSNQIKDFSGKWFNGNFKEVEGEIDKVLEIVKDQRIGSYPMHIGMLLWLVEEKKTLTRLDHNMIIENFVEKLLEKTKEEINTVDAFDFRNRIELLGKIAEKIVQSGTDSLTDAGLTMTIASFLEDKKWSELYIVEQIKNYLLNTNILTHTCESKVDVAFRYHSIHDYFISVRMEKSKEFYNYVTSDKFILHFDKAIDFYSARNRDNHEYVSTVVDFVLKHIEEMNEIITLAAIDKEFERNKSLIPSFQVDKTSEERKLIADERTKERLDEVIEENEEVNEEARDHGHNTFSIIRELEACVIILSKLLRNLEGEVISTNKNSDGELITYDKEELINKVMDASIYLWFMYDYMVKAEYFENPDKKLIPILKVTGFLTPFLVSSFSSMNLATIKLHQYYETTLHKMNDEENVDVTSSEIKNFLLNVLALENSPKSIEGINKFDTYCNSNLPVWIEDNVYAYIRMLEVTSENPSHVKFATEMISKSHKKHKDWKGKIQQDRHDGVKRKKELIKSYVNANK